MSDDIINSKYGETDSHWFISAISMVKLMQSSILSSGSRRRPKKICQKILLTKNFIGPQKTFLTKIFFCPKFSLIRNLQGCKSFISKCSWEWNLTLPFAQLVYVLFLIFTTLVAKKILYMKIRENSVLY